MTDELDLCQKVYLYRETDAIHAPSEERADLVICIKANGRWDIVKNRSGNTVEGVSSLGVLGALLVNMKQTEAY